MSKTIPSICKIPQQEVKNTLFNMSTVIKRERKPSQFFNNFFLSSFFTLIEETTHQTYHYLNLNDIEKSIEIQLHFINSLYYII